VRSNFEPRYNVCPTQTIHAVVEHDGARDIVPMRWKAAPDGKQPFYFSRADGAPITVAGLWDEWRDPVENRYWEAYGKPRLGVPRAENLATCGWSIRRRP
jgi:putative SOS response-associated peptidase YedK